MAGARKSVRQLTAEATAAANDGRTEDAIRDLAEILERHPGDPMVADRIGDLHARLRDVSAAVGYYRQAAEAFVADDRLDMAMAVWRKVLKIGPELVDVHVWLADLYVRTGR